MGERAVVEVEAVDVEIRDQTAASAKMSAKDRDRPKGGLDPTAEEIGMVNETYPRRFCESTRF